MSIGHTYAYEYDGACATIVSVSVLPPPTTLYTWMDVRSSYLTVGLSFSLRHVTDGDPILLGRHGMPGRDACNCDGGSRPRMRQAPFRNVRLNGLKP